ncbi:unnamed protein product [Urochloa humidicola]
MDSSDDETVEVGMDEERRLCGLAGDDDEDDMCEDREALFGLGRSVDDPMTIDGTEPDDDEGPPTSGRNIAKRPRLRPSRSPVWDDYEKLFKEVDGKRIMYGVRCLHCSKEYSALSSGGTGHLTRHIKSCIKRREKTRMSQSQISFNSDGTMRNWDYCPIVEVVFELLLMKC